MVRSFPLTQSADADVAAGVVHASPLAPLVGQWVEGAHRVEVLHAVEAPNHVDESVQFDEAVVSPWVCASVG